jgi:hypothetical protein
MPNGKDMLENQPRQEHQKTGYHTIVSKAVKETLKSASKKK